MAYGLPDHPSFDAIDFLAVKAHADKRGIMYPPSLIAWLEDHPEHKDEAQEPDDE